uniref:C2H2-type domain-containing protein n=1 Tax=Timema tahoe TaxID=61484 RepID=A0A7R9FH56_9NEOP|nr:unnamed protein product [Timema tahoe]
MNKRCEEGRKRERRAEEEMAMDNLRWKRLTKSLHSETLDEERDADFEEGDCRCIVCSREFPELEQIETRCCQIVSSRQTDTAPKQRGRGRVYEGRVKWKGDKNEVDRENEGGDIDWLSDGSGARDGLDGHLVSCHRYPPDQYKCDQCPRTFSWRPTLARHRVTQHGEQRRYPCENCPKSSIANKSEL